MNKNSSETERRKLKYVELSLTICEDSRRSDLDGVDDSDVIQHGDPVAVTLRVVNERSYVDALRWVADSWADRNGDFFIVILIQRLIKIVSQSGSIVERDVDTLAQRPRTLHAANERLKDRLNMTGEAPKSGRDVTVMSSEQTISQS